MRDLENWLFNTVEGLRFQLNNILASRTAVMKRLNDLKRSEWCALYSDGSIESSTHFFAVSSDEVYFAGD